MGYLLVIPDFRGIGGAQLYALRRMKYLAKKGIDSVIAVGLLDQTILNENTDARVFQHEMISKLAFDVKKRHRKDVFKSFIKWCKDEITIIETYDPVGATWGEYLALELNCKHIIYSLIEPPVYKNIQDRPILEFFEFKLRRGEFIGLSSVSLEKIFNKQFNVEENMFVNIAFDTNELAQCTVPDICQGFDKSKFVVGTVSRLTKGYIKELIKAVILLAKNHSNKQFLLIIGGDSQLANIRAQLIEKYNNSILLPRNTEILFPGYLNPLGRDFFQWIDVFVGMGTAAVSSISQSCATVVVDPFLNLSSGVLGIDTNNFAFSENGKQFTILESLEELLTNNEKHNLARQKGLKLFNEEFDLNVCMIKLDRFIELSDRNMEHWNFNNIKISHRIIRFLYINKDKGIIKYFNKLRRRYRFDR